MAARTSDRAMTNDEIAMLREVHERCGGSLVDAAKALGINHTTMTRALAGLAISSGISQYLRLSLPRTLQNMRRKQRVARTG